MILTNQLRDISVIVAASTFAAIALSAQGQEISEGHLKAAHTAVAAIHATDSFDNILPQAAFALKRQLIQFNPDLQAIITQTVDERTLAMAARHADLEKEAALAYAKSFTEKELTEIAIFYNSATGKKLIENGPIASRELVKAADIWQNGIARDLAEHVGNKLKAIIGAKTAPATDGDSSAEAPKQ